MLTIVCLAGFAFWLLAMFTTEPVSKFIAPSKEGVSAIPRLMLSTLWFAFGGLFSFMMVIIFGLLTLLTL